MDLYDWEKVHAQVLGETFDALDIKRATALVGVLSEFEIQYSDALKAVVTPVEGDAPSRAPVLTVEYSARLVAQIFGLEFDDLMRQYRANWRNLRSSDLVVELVSVLEGHRFVGRLSSVSDAP